MAQESCIDTHRCKHLIVVAVFGYGVTGVSRHYRRQVGDRRAEVQHTFRNEENDDLCVFFCFVSVCIFGGPMYENRSGRGIGDERMGGGTRTRQKTKAKVSSAS